MFHMHVLLERIFPTLAENVCTPRLLLFVQVIIDLYSAHMDPDDWQEPQQFRPERFLDESNNIIDRDRVIAFSLGIHRLFIKLNIVTFCAVMLSIFR